VRCLERGSFVTARDIDRATAMVDASPDTVRDAPLLVAGDDRESATKNTVKGVHIFSYKVRAVAEKAMTIWGVLLRQQSDRSLPRTYFPQGALSTQKLNCHEYIGLLLLYDIFFLSTLGDQMMGSKDSEKRSRTYSSLGWLGSDNMSDWVQTLEGLLLLDTLLSQDTMTVEDVMTLRAYMPRFLDLIRHTVNKKDGTGMKTLKYHLLLHIWECILKYGVARNFDTQAGEHNHIVIAKKTAARTQKRSLLLDWQSAVRYIEDLIISTLSSRVSQSTNNKPSSEMGRATLEKPLVVGGWKLCFNERGIHHLPFNKDSPRTVSFVDVCGTASLFNDLKKFLTKTVAPKCRDVPCICMFNHLKKDGITYRASPGRKPTRNLNVGWNDWAYIRWDQPITPMEEQATGQSVVQSPPSEEYLQSVENLVPAHLLCFVRLDEVSGNVFIHRGRTIKEGHYAVCHAVTQRQPEPCEDSLIVKHAMKDLLNNNYSNPSMLLYLVPVENIVKPCICIPNIRGPTKNNDLTIDDAVPNRVDHLLISARDTWSSIFLEHMRQQNTKPLREWDTAWEVHNAKNDSGTAQVPPPCATGRGKKRKKVSSAKTPSNRRTKGKKGATTATLDTDSSEDDNEPIAGLKKSGKEAKDGQTKNEKRAGTATADSDSDEDSDDDDEPIVTMKKTKN